MFGNKKIKIVITVFIVLILGAGGFFWWQYDKQLQIKKDLEKLADYFVTETPEGRIIESKEGDLRVKIPEGWQLKEERKIYTGSVFLMSPELFDMYQGGKVPNIFNSQKGCLIDVGVAEEKQDLEELKEKIKEDLQSLDSESEIESKIVEIDSHQALKILFNSKLIGCGVNLVIPTKNKIHSLTVYSGEEDKEKCTQEFDKFLETVQIQ